MEDGMSLCGKVSAYASLAVLPPEPWYCKKHNILLWQICIWRATNCCADGSRVLNCRPGHNRKEIDASIESATGKIPEYIAKRRELLKNAAETCADCERIRAMREEGRRARLAAIDAEYKRVEEINKNFIRRFFNNLGNLFSEDHDE